MRALILALGLFLSASGHAAITFVGCGTGTDNQSSTATPTLHASVAEDDFLIAFVGSVEGGDSLSTESGWTSTTQHTCSTGCGSIPISRMHYKFAGASESDPTFDRTGSTQTWGTLVCAWRGVDQTTPLDGVTIDITDDNGDDGTYTGGTVTTNTDNAWVIWGGFINDDEGVTNPTAGTNERIRHTYISGGDGQILVYDDVQVTAGATTAFSIDDNGSTTDESTIHTLALRPAASVSVTYDADNYDLGDTVTATPVGYSDLTQIQETVGSDVILDGAGETFVIPGLAELTPSGDLNNTQLGVSLTWEATDGTDTASDTFTIDFPATANDHSGNADCIAGTSCPGDAHPAWASPVTTNDDYYCRFTSGSGVVSDSGVVLLDGPTGTVECRFFDESAGAWLAAVSEEYEAPASEEGECAVTLEVSRPVVRDAVRELICEG